MLPLPLALAATLAAPSRAQEPAPPPTDGPPNVVVVLVDDLGWTDLGCQGGAERETPCIDRLAAEGLRFTNAYASAAVCSPTRAALLTGRHPARLGITNWIRAMLEEDFPPPWLLEELAGRDLVVPFNARRLERAEVTLAEELGAAGYATGFVGKWHLGMAGHYPDDQGFAENHGGCELGRPPSYFDPYQNEFQPGIPTLAPRRAGEYLTDREADEAVRFVEAHAREPFLLYYAPYAVHRPLEAPEELVARAWAQRGARRSNPTYAAMVHAVDRAVGRILYALDEHGLARRTLVVLHSDNGGLVGPTDNAPLRLGKGHPYEGGLRVPLVVRFPGRVPAGAVSDAPVVSHDLLPTILEAAGVERSGTALLDGTSLWAHLTSGGSAPLERESLVWHFPHYGTYSGTPVTPYSVLRAGRYKLIQWWEGPRLELYDLEADPSEAHDLAAAEPERVAELARALRARLESLGAQLPRARER